MSVTIAMPRMSTDPELTAAQAKYPESLARAGADVRWVQLSDPERAVQEALTCDGLLLPGGGDIHGRLPPEETFLLRTFWEARRPILGICRGMQALNVFRGGTLRDDLPGHQIPEGDMVHPSRAEGPLAALLGPCPTVTSSHHQAVDRGRGCCRASGRRTARRRRCMRRTVRCWVFSGTRSARALPTGGGTPMTARRCSAGSGMH